ncbi:MAG: family 1 glycosylhydrolase [Candidatus Moranbacteria bacterium]|nr:family 1 glycosylhydrolase [Candidatus Moranbacteria bacterium]MDD3965215.1 family 1 glycosylhydrolase [Candidatus Moranbacteria bacterium]
MTKLTFPSGFLWGASTASHQVEGNNTNDWSEWEKKNAHRLVQESRQSFITNPHWKQFKQEAINPQNYISGTACDHYARFESDFDLIQELGMNAHRFSLEWSRIEPSEGVFDEHEIEHYRTVLSALHKRGITPFVTLWHWTLPLWLAKQGGVANKRFPFYFARYTKKIMQTLGEDIPFWITLNEPDVVSGHAYLKGAWPPQKKNLLLYYRVLRHLVSAHKESYTLIKKSFPHAQVGIAKHNIWFEAVGNTYINRLLKKIADFFWNDWFLRQIQNEQDFIGLNHYNHHRINNGFNKNENKIQTDFGWEFYPESLYHAVIELKKYYKPIYITEHGIADSSDMLRPRFLKESLTALHRAIADGADVRGYLHWSLLDNFEWDKGYWLRFGLIAVDFTTQIRTPRESAILYADICKSNTLETEITKEEN